MIILINRLILKSEWNIHGKELNYLHGYNLNLCPISWRSSNNPFDELSSK